ncbi:RING finger protein 31 [Penaeus vannamei]|uniref:RING finger protein 31 n=1 Tax=Penaeus vannamei TaxID=6689 RepID=A0A3R7MDJ8_PENVA|nr:RING finger protein 31 [Penaeus vannamei]
MTEQPTDNEQRADQRQPAQARDTVAFTFHGDGNPRLRDKLFTACTVKAHNDDYLVSALETMQTAQTGDDLKSSRETIRSSFEQLPYSEEAFEGEAEAPARPASAGAAVPPTDGYESLSFKDALTSSEASRKQQQTSLDKSAEEAGYTTEDVSIALAQSGDKNPLEWLKENWRHMVDTVLTLATNYGHERRVNDVGAITAAEAKAALRTHKGNIWAAVTECFNDILSRGNFQRQDVVRALETNDGDTDAALQELNKPQQPQPFTMKIWAPPQAPEGQTPKPVSSAHAQVEVQDAPPAPPSPPPPARRRPRPRPSSHPPHASDRRDQARYKEPATRPEPIYATVQKNRKKPKGQDTDKYKKMSKRAEQRQDRRPLTPKRLEVHDGDYENLSPSPRETSPVESDDESKAASETRNLYAAEEAEGERLPLLAPSAPGDGQVGFLDLGLTQSLGISPGYIRACLLLPVESLIDEILAGLGSPSFYEYFTAVGKGSSGGGVSCSLCDTCTASHVQMPYRKRFLCLETRSRAPRKRFLLLISSPLPDLEDLEDSEEQSVVSLEAELMRDASFSLGLSFLFLSLSLLTCFFDYFLFVFPAWLAAEMALSEGDEASDELGALSDTPSSDASFSLGLSFLFLSLSLLTCFFDYFLFVFPAWLAAEMALSEGDEASDELGPSAIPPPQVCHPPPASVALV